MDAAVVAEGPNWFSLVVVPLLIFFARIGDVSVGTLRVMFLARGQRALAPMLGFFEVLIWLIAMSQILQNLTTWYYYVAYAAGFATGTWFGMWIESKLAIGKVLIRVITRSDASDLIASLKERDIRLTYLDAEGATGPVNIIFMLSERQEAGRIISIIKEFNPRAFFSIEDVRYVTDFGEKKRAMYFPRIWPGLHMKWPKKK